MTSQAVQLGLTELVLDLCRASEASAEVVCVYQILLASEGLQLLCPL